MNNLLLDLAFKFVLSDSKNKDASFLLRLLIRSLGFHHVHCLKVLNPNYLQSDIKDKGVRYDVKCEDEHGNHYDIEMQNSHLSHAQIKRFGLYGVKLVSEDIHIGEDYENIRQYVQIIFISDVNQDHPTLVEYYVPRNEEGLDEGHGIKDFRRKDMLLVRVYIYIPYIDEIVKEKGMEELSDLELMVYIIRHGIDEKARETEREVAKAMERRMNLFYEDEALRDQAFDRYVALITDRAEKEEYRQMGERLGRAEGEKLGRSEGQRIGKIESIMKLASKKFHNQNLKWIKECQETQLDTILELIMEDMDYETFYQKINSYDKLIKD